MHSEVPQTSQTRLFRFWSVKNGAISKSLAAKQYRQELEAEREVRGEAGWEKAVESYLEFMSGSAWRRGRTRYTENSSTYEWYLGGLQIIARLKRVYVCDCENCHIHGYCLGGPVAPALANVYARYFPQQAAVLLPRERWIDHPERHLPSCRCSKCRSRKAKEATIFPAKKPVQSVRPSAMERQA